MSDFGTPCSVENISPPDTTPVPWSPVDPWGDSPARGTHPAPSQHQGGNRKPVDSSTIPSTTRNSTPCDEVSFWKCFRKQCLSKPTSTARHALRTLLWVVLMSLIVSVEQRTLQNWLRQGFYFLSLDWKTDLCNLFEEKSPCSKSPAKVWCRWHQWKSIIQSAPTGPWWSLTWNTDGIPIFHSSEYSVWPLEVMINELPFKEWINSMLL